MCWANTTCDSILGKHHHFKAPTVYYQERSAEQYPDYRKVVFTLPLFRNLMKYRYILQHI